MTCADVPIVQIMARSRRERVIDFLMARDQPFIAEPQCFYCKRELTWKTITLDHVIPKSRGGPDTVDNLVIACARCNNKKGDSLPGEVRPKGSKLKCRVCKNGRLIPDGDDSCWACLRPNARLKMPARSCHHVTTWCVGCVTSGESSEARQVS